MKVRFKANGRWVSFSARPAKKRHGRVPKQLRPYLFRAKGRKAGRRKSTWPRGKTPPHLKKFLFRRTRRSRR
jgi:hypothetical protein